MEIEKLIGAFRDPSVSELIVNNDGSVYVERRTGLEKLSFVASQEDVHAFVDNLVGDAEKFGPERPYADLSAQDGSRVHVISQPLVRGGTCVTIRKRPERRWTLEELVRAQTLSHGCAGFLKFAVAQGKNMLIVGGTSSGKTSLLCSLISLVDPAKRIIVLEDTPEVALPQPHVLYVRTRTRDPQGMPDVTLRDLLVNTLRMRPDRIVVGEVRSTEAADLLEVMNTGHEGIMCTLHANSCREALQRLETLVLLSGINMPLKAVRSNIVLAIDLIVFMSKMADGSRRVAQVTEVTGIEVETISMSDLFILDIQRSPAGIAYNLKATGAVPRFYDELRKQGAEPPMDFFGRSS